MTARRLASAMLGGLIALVLISIHPSVAWMVALGGLCCLMVVAEQWVNLRRARRLPEPPPRVGVPAPPDAAMHDLAAQIVRCDQEREPKKQK